jgi:hypothetical protein
MKLPFEFGVKLIFRLVFPGAILAAALIPAVGAILDASGIWIKFEYLFPIEAIAFGWIIVISDMRIYMLFEGRRYWPYAIRNFFIHCQKRRLKFLRETLDAPSVDRRRFLEAGVEYGNYPVDEGGEAYVAHPTRLGNIIDAFETYPKVKYGLDAVFYWYRLWVVLDKDMREEIDNAQAVVDSTVYAAFAFYLSGLVMFIYAALRFSEHITLPYLHWLSTARLPYVPVPSMLFGLGAGCFVVGFVIYRLSLPTHAQFGELFKSVFDQYRVKLNFDDVGKEVERITGNPNLALITQREKNQIVWRYLRWHLIRDEAVGKNLTVKQWNERRNSQPAP